MDGLCATAGGRCQQVGDVQIGLRALSLTNAHCLISKLILNVQQRGGGKKKTEGVSADTTVANHCQQEDKIAVCSQALGNWESS